MKILYPVVANRAPTPPSTPDPITKGDRYLEDLLKLWTIPTVAPEFDTADRVTNADKLIPHEIRIIPDELTIYTDEEEYRRFFKKTNPPVDGILRQTSERCVFVYAFNMEGKLIVPLYPRPKNKALRRCPYQLFLGGNHFNRDIPIRPITAGRDLDVITDGDYNPELPAVNPPHAIMVNAVGTGHYSITVTAGIHSELIDAAPVTTGHLAEASFTVHVVPGVERVDALAATASDESKITFGADKSINLDLIEGKSIELRIAGVKFVNEWQEDKKEYEVVKSRTVTLRELTWSFEVFANEKSAERLGIEPLNAAGTAVRLTGGIPNGNPGATGLLRILGHGRVWQIHVTVLPLVPSRQQRSTRRSGK